MKSKKPSKPIKQDKAWQQRVEKRLVTEKVELNQPQGKERFEQVIKRALKKNPKIIP